jgi:lysophospholipase L1-like esterase
MQHNKHYFSALLLTLTVSIFVSIQGFGQKQTISCVGNSITYGYDLPNPASQSYPGQLQVLLGTDEWTVKNFGASGRTMLKAGGYSYWDDQLYKNALASNPDFVVLKLGTNDSKDWLWDWKGSEFKKDYKEMVQSFQNLSSSPEIWIGLLIPGNNTEWGFDSTYIKDKVNPKIKEIALEMGLGLIDLYTELDSNKWEEWYLPDSIHPSVAGAGIIAKKVNEMLAMQKPEITFLNGKLTAPNGDDFQWYLDSVPIDENNGGKLKEFVVNKSGTYKVSVKLSTDNETRIVSNELYVQITGTSDNIERLNKIQIYPNPASDFIYVQTSDFKNTDFTITDMSGKLILSDQLPNGQGQINIEELSMGTYLLKAQYESVKLFIKR